MKPRFISILLTFCLVFSMLFSLSTAAQAVTASDDAIIEAVLVVFRCKEGTYDSVNRNDNGALSIGKLQWHASRALELMKEIASQNSAAAQSILGDALYQEIIGASDSAWNYRTLSVAEAACFSNLLATDLSHSIQDALARKDISGYITRAKRLGIQDASAIVYYCDLQNQYGPSGAEGLLQKVKALLGSNTILSVDDLHNNLMQVTSSYRSRRVWTYEYCAGIDWGSPIRYVEDSGSTVTYSAPVVDPNLDLTPPEITEAKASALSSGVFQIEVEASDNEEIKDCRVEVGSDASGDTSYALYAKEADNTWIVRIQTDRFSSSAARYYINITVSDTSGNGTGKRLELDREEMEDSQRPTHTQDHIHRFVPVFETEATAMTPACRVSQCIDCHALHTTLLSPALGMEEN